MFKQLPVNDISVANASAKHPWRSPGPANKRNDFYMDQLKIEGLGLKEQFWCQAISASQPRNEHIQITSELLHQVQMR